MLVQVAYGRNHETERLLVLQNNAVHDHGMDILLDSVQDCVFPALTYEMFCSPVQDFFEVLWQVGTYCDTITVQFKNGRCLRQLEVGVKCIRVAVEEDRGSNQLPKNTQHICQYFSLFVYLSFLHQSKDFPHKKMKQ